MSTNAIKEGEGLTKMSARVTATPVKAEVKDSLKKGPAWIDGCKFEKDSTTGKMKMLCSQSKA